ncbi:selenocysteine-specific translation elongation factor [Nautilia profundicola AmH]|uniref:Selenocysteine-specific elongation factor n=1 Tax=Nautilia profundicola (strain ATCC BAA-1463 / DSM 18972 / AmH) TaxID=598659 RepID=B9L5T0_NAUPA|nr:selenocysteine-specific translation elongation factor [Nautilia profundicola]ACM92505.1 selenocysteine-specific translation elongation factor [Nautilia profundicola AmH]
MRNIIIGTAGHVDHGKTSLIEAMTGYNGDELKEEKERGITIDLSFTNMKKGDTNVAFIDVPGHEKLVKNMISGAFGFDASLFAIDANEGVMPQTVEHLEVLNILKVKNIIVALTKCDLADPETIEKRKNEIRDLIAKYKNLHLLEIFETSIYDKQSIEKLKDYLFNLPPRNITHSKFFRYYIDRVFSLKGIGTVVTGTVLSGKVKLKDKIYINETKTLTTVKNLQVHGEDVEVAYTHQRVAINLNINHKELKKGYLLSTKGYLRGFKLIDVFVKPVEGKELFHNMEVLFISGAKRIPGKLLMFNPEDKKGYATVKLEEKAFLVFEDPFVILHNGRVIGGGEVLNPISDPIKKKKKLALLKALNKKDFKTAFEILVQNHKRGFGLLQSYQRFNLTPAEALEIAKQLDNVFIDEENYNIFSMDVKKEIEKVIKDTYEKNRFAFLSPASLKLRLKWASNELIQSVLDEFVKEGYLIKEDNIYKRKDLGEVDVTKSVEHRLYQLLDNSGLTPEAPYNIYEKLNIDRKVGDNAMKKLTTSKKVVRLAHNLFVTDKNINIALKKMREIMEKEGYIDIKKFKEHMPMSRKYIVAYLDYLDQLGDVEKRDNKRYLKN